MLVGYHGHDQTSDPNEFATLESYSKAFEYSKYNGVNLDIGHFTAGNNDAADFLKKHHDRITHIHVKDRKRNGGANVALGTGDTPIKECLTLIRENKWPIYGIIEREYRDAPGNSADISATSAGGANLNPYTAGLPEAMQEALARRYAELFGIFVKYRASISRVTFWGVTDAGSWLNNFPIRGRTNYPLLFDREGKPKAAFFSVLNSAK